MRVILVLLGLVAIVLVVLMTTGMLSLDQTQTGSMPNVKVEGGQAPEFKADVGDLDVGTTNKTVQVPELQVRQADNAAAADQAQ